MVKTNKFCCEVQFSCLPSTFNIRDRQDVYEQHFQEKQNREKAVLHKYVSHSFPSQARGWVFRDSYFKMIYSYSRHHLFTLFSKNTENLLSLVLKKNNVIAVMFHPVQNMFSFKRFLYFTYKNKRNQELAHTMFFFYYSKIVIATLNKKFCKSANGILAVGSE